MKTVLLFVRLKKADDFACVLSRLSDQLSYNGHAGVLLNRGEMSALRLPHLMACVWVRPGADVDQVKSLIKEHGLEVVAEGVLGP